VPFHAASAHEALADVSATVALYQAMSRRSAHSDVGIPVHTRTQAAYIRSRSAGGQAPSA
jgi:hypothetical protein